MFANGRGLAESESVAAEHAEQQLHKVSRAGPGFLPSDCTPLSVRYETIASCSAAPERGGRDGTRREVLAGGRNRGTRVLTGRNVLAGGRNRGTRVLTGRDVLAGGRNRGPSVLTGRDGMAGGSEGAALRGSARDEVERVRAAPCAARAGSAHQPTLPAPVQMWPQLRVVPVQMWAGVSPIPVQMWQG